MAQQVKWTNQAKLDRQIILNYFIQRNHSKTYSQKLNRIFIKEIRVISLYPSIGKKTNSENIRVKISGNYSIIYMIEADLIFILRIWDSRQNPIKLNQRL